MSRPQPLAPFLRSLYGWPAPYALRLSQCVVLSRLMAEAREADPALRPAALLLSWSLSRIWATHASRLGPLSHGKAYAERYAGPPLDTSPAARLAADYLAQAPTD